MPKPEEETPSVGGFEEMVLITVLNLGENAYGVPIRQAISAATGKEISTGAVYTTLDRLENKGLITSFVGEPTQQRGGRAKKYFRIEAEGRRALINAEAKRTRVRGITLGVHL